MEECSPADRDVRASLLSDADLPPVHVLNACGGSSFLLVGDHAGTAIPAALGDMGLSPADRDRHIAVDIGVQALGEMLAIALDAPFVCQRYSRLVVDCNRAPHSPEAMPEISDGTTISGNRALTANEKAQRVLEIHAPYHAAIAAQLSARDQLGMESILVALHSFTSVMGGFARPWDIGVLYDGGNIWFAAALLDALRRESGLVVGDNEPYRMDSTDYTVPLHAFPAGRPYVELEIRQDLLARVDGIASWSERLARTLNLSLGAF